MTKLSPDARDLIEAARAGAAPPPGARRRVHAGVLARVGAGAAVASAATLGSGGSAVAKTALSAGLLVKLAAGVGVAGVILAGAIGVGVAVSDRIGEGAPAAAIQAPAAGVTPASGGTAPVVEAPAPPATPPATAAPAASPAPCALRPRSPATPPLAASSLEAETALLEKAQAELRAGHPDAALAALDENDGEIKHGVLGEERRAERILALCAAGRTAEAKAEAARFLQASPRSPMAARVRSSCAATP